MKKNQSRGKQWDRDYSQKSAYSGGRTVTVRNVLDEIGKSKKIKLPACA